MPSKSGLKNLAEWMLPVAVVLAASLSAYAGSNHGANVGDSGQKSTSATLTISVVLMPVVQAAQATTPSAKSNDAVSYNFPAKHYEQRREFRRLPGDKAPGSNLVLQTLTVVPE